MKKELIDELALLCSARRGSLFALTSTRSFEAIMTPGHFDRYAEHGLRRHDRILVTAAVNEDSPECGELLVLENQYGKVRVAELVRHKVKVHA